VLVSRCDEVETDDCIREYAGIALCELPAFLIFVRHGDDDGACMECVNGARDGEQNARRVSGTHGPNAQKTRGPIAP
jgi:hypothetical protein